MQTLDLKPEAKRTGTHPHTHTPAVRLLSQGNSTNAKDKATGFSWQHWALQPVHKEDFNNNRYFIKTHASDFCS